MQKRREKWDKNLTLNSMLYLVGTPIGNLKEMSTRAVEVLKEVSYIACEDTRTSKVLLDAYDIKRPLKSYHKFNESKASLDIINDLKEGKDIALISDAGMPGISDPGAIIINKLKEENLEYTVVSGPCAGINAYILSGYETPFTFVGFIPEKKRKDFLGELSTYNSTLVFYCSPHSLLNDIKDMYESFGDREACVVRELTKKFEEVTFTTLEKGYEGTIKGEFVVIVNKPVKQDGGSDDLEKDLQILLEMGLSKSDASKVLAKAKNLKKNDIYKLTF